MIALRSGRPWPVRLGVALIVASAGIALAEALADVPATARRLASRWPQLGWNDDQAIIASSALFTIALIPAALIWLRGSRLARWLLVGLAASALAKTPDLARLIGAGADVPWGEGARAICLPLAGLMMFLPPAKGWFGPRLAKDG